MGNETQLSVTSWTRVDGDDEDERFVEAEARMGSIRGPSMPMSLVQPGEGGAGARTFTCYTAPGVVFASEEEMKEHYRSDWHRYNLKRKVAGLAPLPLAVYEERAAREAAAAPVLATDGVSRATQRRLKREAKQEAKAAAAAANPRSKAAHYQAAKDLSEHEYIEKKLSEAEPYDEGSDLFSRHHSESLEANLAYMAKTHGFYIPYIEYVTDLRGLLGYLLEMVYVGNVALISGKQHHSLEAVQAHMRDRHECRIELEGHEDEYGAWYDLEALAAKSPLWTWVEEEVSDEDEDEGEMEAADEAAAGEARERGVAGVAEPMEVNTTEEMVGELLDECVRHGLLTESAVDALTDRVASGEMSDAQLYSEWAHRLAAHKGGGAGAPSGGAPTSPAAQMPLPPPPAQRATASAEDMSVGTSTRSMRWTVRYRPVGTAAEAGALTVRAEAGTIRSDGTVVAHDCERELGHRSMRTFYKQKFRPGHGELLAGFGHNPAMHALLLQYSQAGVLANPMPALKIPQNGFMSRTSVHMQKLADVKQGDKNCMNGAYGYRHFRDRNVIFG